MASVIQNRKSKLTAYLLWCLGFIYCCGIHRFYLGKSGSGILYLCTLGVCGIGQFLDLFLIPSMVDEANRSQSRIINNVTVNIPATTSKPVAVSTTTSNKKVSVETKATESSVEALTGESLDLAVLTKLRYAKQLTFSELWLDLKCDKQHLRERLQVLQNEDLIRIGNRESDGAIIYSYL